MRPPKQIFARTGWLLLGFALLVGCHPDPPRSTIDNACHLFEYSSWMVKPTKRAAKKWKADMATMLSIMHQESAFRKHAKPKRKRFLGIPTVRPSSAYGYAQAIDSTWETYRKNTQQWGADRDDFDDAIDFVGWYMNVSRRKSGIQSRDAYRNYLAYHEGWKGYRLGTWKSKKWLIATARKVERRAERYRAHLKFCGYW